MVTVQPNDVQIPAPIANPWSITAQSGQGFRAEERESTVPQRTIFQKTKFAAELGPRLAAIRAKLAAHRQFRKEQLDHLTMDATEAIVTSDQERLQITLVLESAAESALREVEDAQQRLEQGSYGICERCAEPILWERLEALPMIRLCTSCERLAKLASSRLLHAGFGRAA